MKGSRSLALALGLLGAAPSWAPAQGAAQPAASTPPAQFLQTVTVTVKPEFLSEYEDYVKKIVNAPSKGDERPRVLAYQMVLGGPGATFVFSIPFNKWAEMDPWLPVPRLILSAYGDVEGGRILKGGRMATERTETAVYRLLPELSTRPRAFVPPPAYIFVVRTEVAPGEGPAYEQYLAKVKAAQEQAPEVPTAIRRVSVLGPALVYVTSQPFNKHSERDAWPLLPALLQRSFGEAEGRQIAESSVRHVRKREIYVLAHRPDLSRPGPPPAR